MAVIAKNMDMPNNCFRCPIRYVRNCKAYNKWFDHKGQYLKGIDEPLILTDCPLKPAEGLIAEIEFERDRRLGGEAYDMGKYQGLDMAINIIKEYCGIGEYNADI